MGRYLTPDREWSAEQVAPFPLAWAAKLLQGWHALHWKDRAAANLQLLQRSRLLRQAQAAGLTADANLSEIEQRAKDAARDMRRRLELVDALKADMHSPENIELVKCMQVGAWLEAQNLGAEWRRMREQHAARPSLLRVQCEQWWRRVLKGLHGMTTEACAIGLGLVHKRANCYVSNDAVRMRRAQQARNRAMMENTFIVNELGQDYTIAEAAAKGPANAEIRRAELMTRIAGFELIAKDCKHVADFITVTCPSRMHRMRTAGPARVEENPKFDGTTPKEAQAYLCNQWKKLRTWWSNRGVARYGIRIVEPNHDGTPHWHLLMFYPEKDRGLIHEGLKRYFLLNDSPAEPGALRHRVTIERINWKRGSAAGYVAKYVSKNIDGYRVDRDLYGNPAMEASERVQAWAARWRIRQFQQVGGPPVSVWRELRRLNPEAMDGDEAGTLAGALKAVNTSQRAGECVTDEGQRYTAAMGWQQYVKLQGGPLARRKDHRIVLEKELTGELGRYGEAKPPKPVGVVALGEREQWVSMPLMPRGGYVRQQSVITTAQSERHEWIVVPRSCIEPARAQAVARGEAVRPWTRVNNCTAPHGRGVFDAHPEAMFGPVRQVRPKVGRVFNWARRPRQHEQHQT